jgi:hypothetical protein
MADEPRSDPLRALEERLARASEAAERLMGEAAGMGQSPPQRPPVAGWQAEGEEPASPGRSAELESLFAAIRSVRDLIPPEVAERLVAALREFLLALRSLIEWYLERLEQRRQDPPDVQDIPIQ